VYLLVLTNPTFVLKWKILVDEIVMSSIAHNYIESVGIFMPSESNKWVVEIGLQRELIVLHFLLLRTVVLSGSLTVDFLPFLNWLSLFSFCLGILFPRAEHE